MMKKTRRRQLISMFLLLIFVGELAFPAVSYALTSGPTAPEYTSFEPVDTTDMVNLSTGDLVYNMPVLEVPGPEGGYPLSLSYHSGIMLEEEASWVGLGWTLNPGAIVRTVNGIPDDQLGNTRTVRDFDRGAERNTFSLGVGVPGADFKLAVSHDSNQGLGFGAEFGPNIPLHRTSTGISDVTGSFNIGFSPFGGSYVSAGVSKQNAQGLAASIGVTTNFNTVGGGVGLGFGKANIGANISSQGIRGSAAIGGYSFNQVNSQAGRITTEGFGFSAPIGFLTLGYNYLRYYSDEKSEVKVIGSLHANESGGKDADDWTLDSYALLDPDRAGGIVKNSDPEVLFGGSFPSYDQYIVSSQGVSGSIQPSIFDNGTLFRQNVKVIEGESNDLIKYSPINDTYGFLRPVSFRFNNDFSNSFTYNRNRMEVEPDGDITFNNEGSGFTPEVGFNSSKQHLAGSKHVQWFKNQEIIDGTATSNGLIVNDQLINRETPVINNNAGEQIGAFLVTNETGVTYHYTFPVYAFAEESRIERIDNPGIFHEEKNPQAYAYTWLLTAITGPDFVDRNNDGKTDEGDFGYWVRFDYGIHSNGFVWRNPGKGFHIDLDNESKMFSTGRKQLAYLKKISTRTHSAYFKKSIRRDAKGLANATVNGGTYKPFTRLEIVFDQNGEEVEILNRYIPAMQLKLDKIVLLSNDDARRLAVDEYFDGFESLDDNNPALQEIVKSANRVVSFEHSYNLVQGVLNSFDLPASPTESPLQYDTTGINLSGKLTLEAVEFTGKGDVSGLIPPVTFEYGKNPSYEIRHSDIWGFYKSDYDANNNPSLAGRVSNQSALELDAWSLTRINTSLGASIELNYEPDDYARSSVSGLSFLPIDAVSLIQGTIDEIELQFEGGVNDFSYLQSTFIQPELLLFKKIDIQTTNNGPNCSTPGNDFFSVRGELFEDQLEVLTVAGNTITVRNQSLFEKLTSKNIRISQVFVPGDGCDEKIENFDRGHDFVAGVLKLDDDVEKFGGGVRIKSVSITNGTEESITSYTYSNNGRTTGSTSYEPTNLVQSAISFPNNKYYEDAQEEKKEYGDKFRSKIETGFSKLLAISRELPSPGVIYSQVLIEDKHCTDGVCANVEGSKKYEFQTFEQDLVTRVGRGTDNSNSIVRCVIIDPDTGQEEPVNCSGTNPAPQKCYNQQLQEVPCGQSFVSYSPMTIRDFSSWLGALKKITMLDENDQPLTETTNHYLHDNIDHSSFINELRTKYGGQGIVTQIFNENKGIKGFGATLIPTYVFSRKDQYPLVPLGQTVTNYKTGVTTTSTTKAFDFYTGAPVKVLSTDSYGNSYLSVTEPAYTHYPGMGLKVNNPSNKHMLTQTAATYNYKLNGTGQPSGLLSAAIQTWSDQVQVLGQTVPQENIWRQQEAFQWNGQSTLVADGTYPIADFDVFDFANLGSNTEWERTGGITLYDTYSHALEATDINGNFAATRMDPKQRFVTASTANAAYKEMAYSGVEFSSGNSFNEGDVSRGSGSPTMARAHTGKYSLLTGFNKTGFTYTLSEPADLSKSYRASVWVYVPGEAETQSELDNVLLMATVGGVDYAVHPVEQKNKSKSWYQLNLDFDPQDQEVTVRCVNNSSRGVYFDDFRVHPLNATMTSYVYDDFSGELSFILDANNFYTHFEYDAMGRLIRTSREMLNFVFGDGKESFKADRIINEVIYNYGKSN